MKRIINLILTLVLLLALAGCSGTYAKTDLKEPIAIPENGIIEKSILEQIKTENAIATFTGSSGAMKYEWTIFGSDLVETRDIHLSLTLNQTDTGIKIKFSETEDFGFPALLSIHLNEIWNADSATAYDEKQAIYSVSITESKTTILNIPINKIVTECEILPDNVMQTENIASTDTNIDVPSENDNNAVTNSNVITNVDNHNDLQTDDYISNLKEDENLSFTENQPTSDNTSTQTQINETDDYLSAVTDADNRIYSDGKATDQDKYKTDPVPEGKPLPVEPDNQTVNGQKTYTCTFSIECSTIFHNLTNLNSDKRELIPSNGVILPPTTVTFFEGESVFDVLQRICKEKGIHLESSWTPIYNSAYIEGIHNLYEFDCGELSGWMYRINGWYPNYGCSRYQLADGEKVEWRYTCDLGKDVGCDWMQ